ncbi:MAG: glycosyltransferase family 4 protein [Anaerolineales bacterium]|nr:glycosyltransferase family 4 protein [Anaerolineales bacterium]
MRILFVSSQYPPYELGGYEQLCHEVTTDLLTRGHDVRVLTSRYGIHSEDEIHVGNVTRSLHLMADIHYYKPLDFFLKLPSQEKKNLAELKQVIDQFKPDIVMFWGMFGMSHTLPYWAEKWMPGRTTYYMASYWPIDEDLHMAYWMSSANRWVTEQLKQVLRTFALARLKRTGYPPKLQFENVICCSSYVRDRLVDDGIFPSSAYVVYAGADPAPFQNQRSKKEFASESTIRLLYFGRLVPDKGVHTAIEAIGLLKKNGLADQVELTILGDGHPDYKNLLHRRVEELGIADHVHFSGKVAREDIPEKLSHFDVFLFTSIWPEPFGRTIVEAMMAGLVVIGSDVGGSREIFQHYDKEMLFQPEDAQGLADRIIRIISDSGLGQRLIDSGRRLAFERFTIHQMTNGIEKFLIDVSKHADVSESAQ